jgi:hypothetical protein
MFSRITQMFINMVLPMIKFLYLELKSIDKIDIIFIVLQRNM